MKQGVKWWQWLVAAGFVLAFGFFLQNRVLNPPFEAPPVARANGLTDEQVKQQMHDEVKELNQHLAAHGQKPN